MKVKAAPGLSVPKESQPCEYITEDLVTEVEPTAYYLRRLAEGDLVEVIEESARTKRVTKGDA
ncbi:DUF2635 domain-containing protein [Cupriavidus sp. BIC8F]|uniref:DUF2635 domain-containing protein n=1 Tax=Cupriavidus sp. BIC8F TaxID=3079014 RepID=UPI0029167842|nr:DUF2635 domain-containing protein [Cupriavidus sp. BIC8F]